MITFFDFETNGLIDRKLPWDHPSQCHIASMAAVCFEASILEEIEALSSQDITVAEACNQLNDLVARRECNSLHFHIKPDGWTMPDEVAAINGLTMPLLEKTGVPMRVAMNLLDHLFFLSEHAISYNMSFDGFLYDVTRTRLGRQDFLQQTKRHCAMHAAAALLKLPGKYGDYAWPKLGQAYEHVFQIPLAGAHNGLIDTRATAYLAFEMKRLGHWDLTF